MSSELCKVVIKLEGFEDSTTVVVEMTEEQLNFLTDLAETINEEATRAEQPSMYAGLA